VNPPEPAIFTTGEMSYIAAQKLGRLATIGPGGNPQVNPVSCYYNPARQTIDIGGHAMASSRKYRNARANPRVAVVLDDMPSAGSGGIRCLEIRGTAETIDKPADSAARAPGAIIRIHPHRIISWGIDPPGRALGARTVPSRTAALTVPATISAGSPVRPAAPRHPLQEDEEGVRRS
jgi:pyridoxamine 5'-phosphate oxidase family protein